MARFRIRKNKVFVKPIVKKKKQQQQQPNVDHITGDKIPESFVFSRGKLPGPLRQLQMDLRKLMLPYTALKLKEKKRNNLKDFLNVAGPMGVTHFLILSKTEASPFLRVAKTPQGPLLHLKYIEYSLAVDIAQSQLRPRCPQDLFKNPPLIVLSGFAAGDEHLKLTTTMFKNIFLDIDINTLNHSLLVSPVESETLSRTTSEADEEAATVTLTSDLSRVNRASTKSAVKLQEIGPRMTLQLIKIEGGLCSGEVMFSEHVLFYQEMVPIRKSETVWMVIKRRIVRTIRKWVKEMEDGDEDTEGEDDEEYSEENEEED
ncbi:hypothetical protein REPUB_Repub12eG0135100 [Reevesia pubescens]